MKKFEFSTVTASALACIVAFALLVVLEAGGTAIAQDGAPPAEQAHTSRVAELPSVPQGGDPKKALPQRVARLLNAFFENMQQAKIDAAYDALLEGSKINSRREDVASLHDHARKAITEYGAIQSFDILQSRFAGQNLLRVTVLSVGADYPLCWRFYFYKGGQDWRLLDLRVDDGLSGMFNPDAEDHGAPTVVSEPSEATGATNSSP